jgi:signal transduction histidine kinase
VLVLAIVALLVPLGLSLRDRVDAEVRLQARSEAEVVAARAAASIRPPRPARLEDLARRAGRVVRGRVIIVNARGRLLADSAGEATVGEAYGSRPEIAAALAGNVEQTRRGSSTLGEEILATAVPVIEGGRPEGAVRVTQSVSAVNRAVRRTWLGLGLIGALVLGLGLIAGAIIAGRVARPILRLDDAARRVAAGDLSARARVEGSAEQRELAETFNAMTARLALLLGAQREFVADASHQLRTPLAGLRLRIEEAQAQATGATQREDLEAALGEVDRLARIVTELLELSRAAEGGRPAATTLPGAAVRRAAARFGAPAAAAGCTLHADPGAEPGLPVACHEADLDRILDVLLENAIAYAPGAPVEIAADGPAITVRDHGPGLDGAEAEAVFERFHRGSAGRTGPPGTGLGLAIARELARRWGGEVTLEPAAGAGTLARVRLHPADFPRPLPGGS